MSELLAFSVEQACRLTGLSRRQLEYWDRTGFFAPRYADDNRRRPYSRIYAFRDVVGLRAIAVLRNEHRVPLQDLRTVGNWLASRAEDSWANLTLYVAGRRVFFEDPSTGARVAARPPGQTALPIHMERIFAEVRSASEKLRERRPEDIGTVSRNRFVTQNAPVLAGTRIPTSAVWNLHNNGYDAAAIIRGYPRLTEQDVCAALAHEEQGRVRQAG